MKILLCNFEYPPLGGGGGVFTAWLAQELAKRHEVTVLTSQAAGTPKDSVQDNVRVVRVPVLFRKQKAVANMASMLAYVPMGILEGFGLTKQDRFDVVNTHFVLPTGPTGHMISQRSNIPNVLTLLGGDVYDPSKFTSPHRHYPLRVAVRWLLQKADVVVGSSSNTVQNLRVFYELNKAAEHVLLGVPRVPQETAARSDYGFTDEILLVSVARLVPRKNIGQLIDMLKALGNDRVHLLIMGTGPEENNLRALAAQHQISENVHFLGFVEESEKFRILNMADIFVSASYHEGFGLVFLEAMGCGLPVICYDYGGQTDFLEDGVNGFLVPHGDLGLFTERCRNLVENAELRRQYGETNRQAVEAHFIDNCAVRYESLFERAIHRMLAFIPLMTEAHMEFIGQTLSSI